MSEEKPKPLLVVTDEKAIKWIIAQMDHVFDNYCYSHEEEDRFNLEKYDEDDHPMVEAVKILFDSIKAKHPTVMMSTDHVCKCGCKATMDRVSQRRTYITEPCDYHKEHGWDKVDVTP